jgi:putative DNA primase/helicase
MTKDTKNKQLEKNPSKPSDLQGHAVDIKDREPWLEPVSGDWLVAKLVEIILKYIAMSESAAVAIALWIIHTYVFDIFTITPILAITSPEKGCGKTTLLDVLYYLVQRAQRASNIKAAGSFRLIEIVVPSLLIDEADTFINSDPELIGILNSGNRKGGEVIRVVGNDYELRAFYTCCPKAIAAIKNLPETIKDRAISIALKRRRPDEYVSRFSATDTKELETLARMCARWANDHRDALSLANPDIPDFLFNRAADNWRVLLAIADEVGCGSRARNAAKELTEANQGGASSLGTELLFDIWLIFEARKVDRLSTKELIAELILIEDRPWAEFKGGKSISPHQLADILHSFGIASSSIRIAGNGTPKGYKRDQFIDAWIRYLSSPRCEQTATVADCGVSENAEIANKNPACGDVAPFYDGCSPEDDEIPF